MTTAAHRCWNWQKKRIIIIIGKRVKCLGIQLWNACKKPRCYSSWTRRQWESFTPALRPLLLTSREQNLLLLCKPTAHSGRPESQHAHSSSYATQESGRDAHTVFGTGWFFLDRVWEWLHRKKRRMREKLPVVTSRARGWLFLARRLWVERVSTSGAERPAPPR